MIHTDVTICNLAIGRVSGDKIDSLDEESPLGVWCADNYPHLRDVILGKYRWTFANQVSMLAQVALTPGEPAPCAMKFAKPADLSGAVHAWRDAADPQRARRAPYVLEANGFFWCDTAPLFAEYTAARPEGAWPSWFRNLVVTALAGPLADHCQRATLARELKTEAWGTPSEQGQGGLFGAAMAEDSRMAPQRQLVGGVDPGPLVGARGGYGGPSFTGFRLQSEG